MRIQTLQESSPASVQYLTEHYHSASRGNYDIYVAFVERALNLLNPAGKLGYILPHKFFNAQYGQPTRELLGQGAHLSEIVHFGHQQVFDAATTYTCLLFLNRTKSPKFEVLQISDLTAWRTGKPAERAFLPAKRATDAVWNFSIGPQGVLAQKLIEGFPPLDEFVHIFVGLQTSADDVFIMKLVEDHGALVRLHSKSLGQTVTLERDLLYPILSGTDVTEYATPPPRQFIIFPYAVKNLRASLIPWPELQSRYPLAASLLERNRERLAAREKGKFNDDQWYRFGRSQNLGIQNLVKICVPRLVSPLCAAFDSAGKFFLDNVDVGGVTWKESAPPWHFHYLLAILNCRLSRWLFPHISAPFRGGYMSANRQFLSQLPIHNINLEIPQEKEAHDCLVRSVGFIIEARRNLASATLEKEINYWQGRCDGYAGAIDALVYDLYGLTPEEIALVEGAAAGK